MKLNAIELPIDFGHTDLGRYAPMGQAEGARVLADFFFEMNPECDRDRVAVTAPNRDEPQECPLKFDDELREAVRAGSDLIQKRISEGVLPVVFGGDHAISLATATGASRTLEKEQALGAIVFDAHTDFNLPGPPAKPGQEIMPGETFSGNAHGMIHALLCKLAPENDTKLSAYCHLNSKLDPARVVVIGGRSKRYPQLDQTIAKARPFMICAEELALAKGPARATLMKKALERATRDFTEPFYFSLDCDVIDPTEFPAVATPVPKGLLWGDLTECFHALKMQEFFQKGLKAVDIAEYCASKDPEKTHAKRLIELVSSFLRMG